MRWTADMDAIARERWERGETGPDIAKVLGITSMNAVKCRALRQGWGRRQADGTLLRATRAPRLASPEIVPEPEPEVFRYGPVPLLSARLTQCRYFLSERPDWVVCGEQTARGSSWCPKHVKLCFNHNGRRAA